MNGTNKVGGLISQLHQRWCDPAMFVLLVVQCIAVFGMIPAAASRPLVPASVIGVVPLLCASLVIFTTRTKWTVAIGSVALGLFGCVIVLAHFQENLLAVVTQDLLAISAFLLLTATVLVTVFAPGRFTTYRAFGSLIIYLNIGLLFTLIFRLIVALSVHAFSGLPATNNQPALRAALEYFSFSALTSVGFGDIVPLTPIARGMTILEASIGHIYPATLLARVVTRVMHARGE
ncbi:hypothetical protein C6Q07_32845 [Burkholderia multivorans]|jgi:hypothetical protein|uniref:ion channel n=1 Tax=Burkholderia multivorans TaxID=87883 RepID=UPI000D00E99E|nr:ion channel [Burkholderia multivorans]MBU9640069.1 hypothetical protein [Burkholderia multivorans]PRE94859.1 hypothetical protein C6Q07_32845 [Burkholderia multivorans]PRG41481.1 hypothetical protein C6T68_05640 [Burkholderia multivorans]